MTDPFWLDIRIIVERMQWKAPKGQEARVRVQLTSGESFEPSVVKLDDPWCVFEAADENNEPKIVAVQAGAMSKVEVVLKPVGDKGPLGFVITESVEEIVGGG